MALTNQEQQAIIDAVLAQIRLNDAAVKAVKIELWTINNSEKAQYQNRIIELGRPVYHNDAGVSDLYIGDGETQLKNLSPINLSVDISGKVDKATGYSLTKNDLSDALKTAYDNAVIWVSNHGNVDNTSDATKQAAFLAAIRNGVVTAGDDLAKLYALIGGKESSITSGISSQYWRGDKSWQTLDNSAVGLGNVPNTDCTNAANITSGVLDIARIPSAALERIYFYTGVQTSPENFGLTLANVQTGDTVKVNNISNASNGLMWIVKDDSLLNSANGFEAYTAGSASAVPWSGVTSKPTNITDIAAATFANDDFVQKKAGVLSNRTIAQVKTDLSLTGTNSGDETTATVGTLIHSATAEIALADNYEFALSDPNESNVLKKITYATLKTLLGAIYQAAGSYITASSTDTLTNKCITNRVGSTTSSATPTINTDNVDVYKLTAQTVDITSFTTNLSGTPTDTQLLEIIITGTAARAIAWGASFVSSTVTLPTTTVTTATLRVTLQWDSVVSKWVCIGVA